MHERQVALILTFAAIACTAMLCATLAFVAIVLRPLPPDPFYRPPTIIQPFLGPAPFPEPIGPPMPGPAPFPKADA